MKRRKVRSIILSLLLTMCLVLSACGGDEVTPTPPADSIELIEEGTYQSSGVSTGNLANGAKYYPAARTKAEADAMADKLNRQINDEGQVLLYNNGALPLKADERKVSLMGIASQDIVVSGGGSGQARQNSQSTAYDWNLAFAEEGFELNPKLVDIYKGYVATGLAAAGQYLEADPAEYVGSSLTRTYETFRDAAIIVFHRWGTENADLRTYNARGHSDITDTDLDLQDNEEALIRHAKQFFNKVIVVINSSNPMAVGELAQPKTKDNLGVDAILWVGGVGQVGCLEAVRIMKGDVNPSGHLPDSWFADLKADPTFTNVSTQQQIAEGNGRSDAYFRDPDGKMTVFSLVEYREHIYLGYKYYETVYDDMIAGGSTKQEADAWYKDVVAFPFGHGLSYTTFKWELAGRSKSTEITSNAQLITVKVKVTNTGNVAGKDVVQLYSTPPYYNGGIEKASVNLVGLAKTKLLQPGESEVVTIQIKAQDLASYDWNDANDNDFAGYEIEHGDYYLSARRDSHTPEFAVKYTVKEDILCRYDLDTGAEVKNVFTDDGYMDFTIVRDDYLANMATRKDRGLTQPAPVSLEDRTLTEAEYQLLLSQEFYTPYNDEEGQPWYVKDVNSLPANWTQAATANSTADLTALRAQLVGVPYHEPKIVNGVVSFAHLNAQQLQDNAKWDAYMNALTWDELVGYYASAKGPLSGGLTGSDGPVTFGGGACWPTCPVTAATWNLELIEAQGWMLGTQALLNGTTGWRGGGINLHRSPYNGRAFEYYSEDGVLMAAIAKAVDTGVTGCGIMCYWKHYFANDQEYRRANFGGISTFCTEQAFREIYLKPFEAVIKNGTFGVMTSFNRLGFIVNSNNYASHQKLLRDEWGYRGGTVNDRWCKAFCPQDLMLRAGDTYLMGSWNEYPDGGITWGKWDPTARGGKGIVLIPTEEECAVPGGNNVKDGSVPSATQYYVMRLAAARDIYNEVNSCVIKNNVTAAEFGVTAYAGAVKADAQSNAMTYQIASEATKDFSITGVAVYPTEEDLEGITPTETTTGSGNNRRTNYTYTTDNFVYTESYDTNNNLVSRQVTNPAGKNYYQIGAHRVTQVNETQVRYEYSALGVTLNINSEGVNNTVNVKTDNLGELEVPITVKMDNWLNNISSTLKIKVVSALCVNGKEYDGKNITVAKGSEVTIDSNYYRYMDLASTYPHMVISAYSVNGSTWQCRNEDQSAADIVTLDISKAQYFREPSYTVTLDDGSALPAGITTQDIKIYPIGYGGLKYSTPVVDGVKIKFASNLASGTYSIKVALKTYATTKPTGGNWFQASAIRERNVQVVINFVVQ